MQSPDLDARSQAYAKILKWALLSILELARQGNAELCEIEADHVHNIPSMFGETTEARHRDYIVRERGFYLERLRERGHADYLADRKRFYDKPWSVLGAITLRDDDGARRRE